MILQLLTVLLLGYTCSAAADEIDFQRRLNYKNFNATPRYIFLKDNGLSFKHPEGQKHKTRLAIVNGQPATRGQFCYSVYLQFSDRKTYWACGGSLVSPTTILTAAHCVQGAQYAVAALGVLDLKKQESGRQISLVSRSGLRAHEKYDENRIYNDIAVVKLRKPAQLTDTVCTVKLPGCSAGGSKNPEGNSFTVSGWGKTSDESPTSTLMYVDVDGEQFSSCASFYKRNAAYTLTQSQICTSGAGGRSTCNGDSGGPLVQRDPSGGVTQRGVVSLGMSSCETSAPSVYTDLGSFTSWICPQLSNGRSRS